MRKDYIPVESEHADETAFVEDFWTNIWDTQDFASVAHRRIEKSEEYRLLNTFLKALPKGSRLLDGGCGLGEWTIAYQAKGYHVVGLDISEKTISRLKERFPEQEFVVGDIRKIPFPDNSFDAYFAWGTFEHFEEGLGKCFAEAWRILRPGGYLAISLPFDNRYHRWQDGRQLEKWDDAYDAKHGYETPMRFYQWRLTKPELAREFALHGFRVLQIESMHKATGIHRALKHQLGLTPGTPFHRLLQFALYPVLPKSFIAHMLIGIGQKRDVQ